LSDGEPLGRGDQFEPAAGDLHRYAPGQVFPRQAEQLFPYNRLVLG